MDKEQIKKLAENPNNISGIYNYCDRWCERCTFTSRCLKYNLTKEHYNNSGSKDTYNRIFWEKLSEMYKVTFEMLDENIQDYGIDINKPDSKEEENRLRISLNLDCSRVSKEYSFVVKSWFEVCEEALQEREIEIGKLEKLNISNKKPENSLASFYEAIEVIHWYQYQIPVKIKRAISGKTKELKEPEAYAEFPSDADGSAKVALIGIDHSIEGWGELYQQFPEKEDSILSLLVMLEKLRKKLELNFPDARNFIRPGFDEE